MKDLIERKSTIPTSFPASFNYAISRGLGSHSSNKSPFSTTQNNAILIVGIITATISLCTAIVTFQWFARIRRTFRHHLIFLLIMSDMFKALWYFIFPVVVFTNGPVKSSSGFCQTIGFFLALGTEASDFAILVIALHSALYVFHTTGRLGEGGIYPYRYWAYTVWVIFPVLSASLAFINPEGGYVTSGTFCYLPKRPFWYRLALSYIPRYLIFVAIFMIYAGIWIYVRLKFKRFNEIGNDSSKDASDSHHSIQESKAHSLSVKSRDSTSARNDTWKCPPKSGPLRDSNRNTRVRVEDANERPEWESVNFITTAHLRDSNKKLSEGISSTDFAPDSVSSSETQVAIGEGLTKITESSRDLAKLRKDSGPLRINTDCTNVSKTQDSVGTVSNRRNKTLTNELLQTRNNILRQLRLLFVYPVVYVLMWCFPFVSICLQYSDYYAAHPPFWLNIISVASLALQAGVDGVVFSFLEKPWRRIESSKWLSAQRLKIWTFKDSETSDFAVSPIERRHLEENVEQQGGSKRSLWWEEEGKKRKDSVWLGTDTYRQIARRQDGEAGPHE